jgi:hypothetical protein
LGGGGGGGGKENPFILPIVGVLSFDSASSAVVHNSIKSPRLPPILFDMDMRLGALLEVK